MQLWTVSEIHLMKTGSQIHLMKTGYPGGGGTPDFK